MRSILWAMALLFPLASLAQDTLGTRFEIVAWWSPNDAYLYRVEKIKEVYKNGERTTYDSSAAEVLFEVLDSTETEYRLGWTYQTALFEGHGFMTKLPDSIVAKLTVPDAAGPTGIVYKTDEVGSLLSIENASEIRMTMLSKLAVIEDMYSDQKQREAFQKIMAPIKDIYTSDAGIEQLVAKELQLFHMLFGVAIDSGSTIDYDDQLANLFGGDPIPAKARLIQTTMDTAAGTFTVINELVPNEKAIKKLLQEVMGKLTENKKEAKQAVKKMNMQMFNRHEIEMYYGYYLPKSIQSEQRFEVQMPGDHSVRINRLRIYMPETASTEETPVVEEP